MNANPKFVSATATVDEAAIAPLPNSRKIYVQGSRPDIRVPMREISQSDTAASFGAEKNPPVFVYDTSGPYTDPAGIDIRSGLDTPRLPWIRARRHRGAARPDFGLRPRAPGRPELAELRFNLHRMPRRARPAPTSPRCTTRGKASSRRRWNSSRSAKTCAARTICAELKASGPMGSALPT